MGVKRERDIKGERKEHVEKGRKSERKRFRNTMPEREKEKEKVPE